MRIWHYTIFDALEGIFGDGKLLCDRIYLKGEIPSQYFDATHYRSEGDVPLRHACESGKLFV